MVRYLVYVAIIGRIPVRRLIIGRGDIFPGGLVGRPPA